MMNDTLKSFLAGLAPTVASALLGPMGGVAVAGLAKIFDLDGGTVQDVTKAISDGRITPEQIAEIPKLELQFQQDEKERGFRYAELEFKDRDSARRANVDGGVQGRMFVLSCILLTLTLGTEVWILFNGYPATLQEVIVGRILGLLDSIALLVLGYHYGTSSGSARKTDLMSKM